MKLVFLSKMLKVFLLFISLVLNAGCLSSSGKDFLYQLDFDEDYISFENALIPFTFTNLSDKEIISFTLVLNFLTEAGEPAFFSEQASFSFSEKILPGDTFDVFLNLKEYLMDENVFLVKDYYYIEHIEYSDGSVWVDYLGRFAQ